MNRNLGQFIPQQGMDVYGSDGEKVGEIDTVEQDYFVVRKGFFFPEDHYIPLGAVESFEDDAVYLGYTKEQVLEQQWSAAPEITASDEADVDGLERDTQPYTHQQDTQRTHVNEDDELRVDIHEEELVARRREVDRGDVVVSKRVVEEEAEVDVPVTEERVEVSRRAVDRAVEPGDHAFQEDTVEVPVHGEEVEVEKQARVVEEIDIDKTADTHTERVRETVRHEEVDIGGEQIERSERSTSPR